MRVCVLTTALDVFRGGNHLPLFAALPDISFTILTQAAKVKDNDLPANVRLELLPGGGGSYYYGIADRRFAANVLRMYPPEHTFWKQFQILHLNQTLHPSLLTLQDSGVPFLYAVHHPVTVDLGAALGESSPVTGLLWRARYYSLICWQRSICRRVPRIMTVSETVAARLQDDYTCDPAKISIVPNGVDGTQFALAADSRPEFDLIALGSFLHPRRGFPYLLEVYRALAGEGRKIADVGRRSPAQRSALARIPGVTVFGTVEQAAIPSFLQRSAALISTSLYEGFGLSLIEALACGRPAFAFDGGAVSEVLQPIDPQLIVPLRDTQEMVRRIRAFLARPLSERSAHGRRYRELVLERYALATSARALWEVYERLRQESR
jgi:glycosyltransferase involved in cell wall biosynthesis